jgi:hypothetical protein
VNAKEPKLPEFPLFAAPIAAASGYIPDGTCSLCGSSGSDRLKLGVGADVVHTCGSCKHQFAVPADEHEGAIAKCPGCAADAPIRPLGDQPATCVPCLRNGRVAFIKDTEYGMVRWEDAIRGVTHGVPGLRGAGPGFTLTDPNSDGWVGVVIPTPVLLELTRTPTYVTWQGDQWLFCCATAMVYIGEWTRADFIARAPADPQASFLEVVKGAVPWMWDHVPERLQPNWEWSFYIFTCQSCGRFRGHYDMT